MVISMREKGTLSTRQEWVGLNPLEMRSCCAEHLSGLASGRATLPLASACSIRMTFHNLPLEMHPPPRAPSNIPSIHTLVIFAAL